MIVLVDRRDKMAVVGLFSQMLEAIFMGIATVKKGRI